MINKMNNPISTQVRKEQINGVKYNNVYQDNNKYKNGTVTQGSIVIATLTLLSITTIAALATILIGFTNPHLASLLNTIGGIGVVVMTIIALFSHAMKTGSFIGGSLLSLFQGLMLGGFTYSIGSQVIGNQVGDPLLGWNIVLQALIATIGLFFTALLLYKSGLIRPSDKFRSFLFLAISGFGVLYLINFGLTFILHKNLLMSDGPIPIIIGIIAIILGTLSLITEFQSADEFVQVRADNKVKWALATSIVSSLVWLYMEILRVLYLLRN